MPLSDESGDLVALCRICFGIGTFCLKTHKVSIEHDRNISVEEMLKKFTASKLNSENIPAMICRECLPKLKSSFCFYKKVQEADHKLTEVFENLKNIYGQADDIVEEADIESDNQTEQHINLEILEESYAASVDQIDEHTNLEVLEERIELDNLTEECTEETESCEGSIEILDMLLSENEMKDEDSDDSTAGFIIPEEKPSLKRKFSKKIPQLFLTDGVASLISNFQKTENDTTTDTTVIRVNRTKSRTKSTKKYLKSKDKSDRLIEKGSFVVAQFIPSNATIQIELPAPDCVEELTVNELRTMDYAAVEIKGSKQIEINEEDCSTLGKNDRVYLCQYCPRAFSSSQFLITHVRKSHACKYCTKAFEKNSDLFEHIRREHSSHKCVICDRDFSTNSNLRHHLKKVHGVKLPVHISLLSFKTDGNENNFVDDFEHEERLEDMDGILFA